MTRIIPGRIKHRAFRKGQVISEKDVPRLKDMGKEHIYVWEPEENMVHEDEAALHLARLAVGPGLKLTEPNQGRVNIWAGHDGLLKVQVEQLHQLNNLDDIVFATLHSDRIVTEGQTVAGTRVVPIAVPGSLLEEAERVFFGKNPMLTVKPFLPLWVAVITTGTEVNNGRIKDGFARVIRQRSLLPGALDGSGHRT